MEDIQIQNMNLRLENIKPRLKEADSIIQEINQKKGMIQPYEDEIRLFTEKKDKLKSAAIGLFVSGAAAIIISFILLGVGMSAIDENGAEASWIVLFYLIYIAGIFLVCGGGPCLAFFFVNRTKANNRKTRIWEYRKDIDDLSKKQSASLSNAMEDVLCIKTEALQLKNVQQEDDVEILDLLCRIDRFISKINDLKLKI